jgi:hypothetical protein
MTKYGGHNNANSIKYLFQERIKWFNAFRDPDKDFELTSTTYLETNLYEHVFFHRVNRRFETIVPNEDYLAQKQTPGSQTLARGNPLALAAFESFSSKLRNNFQTLTADIHEDLLSPRIFRSYISPSVFYTNYINRLFTMYHNYIQTNNYDTSISHFSDYVKLFLLFLKQKGTNFPFSFTSWQKSGRSNIFSTGLAFSISPLDCSDDRNKEEFISNPGFQDYVAAAGDSGFHVLASCPWVMVYSLKSINAKKYLTGDDLYTFTNETSIYNYFYNKTYLEDIIYIKDIIIYKYNNYIQNKPYFKKTYWNGCKTCISNVHRESVDINNMSSKYDELYWLKFYNRLRNIEEGEIYTDADVDRIEEKIIIYQKKLDKAVALSYINDQYRFFYVHSDYGINEYLRNLQSEE